MKNSQGKQDCISADEENIIFKSRKLNVPIVPNIISEEILWACQLVGLAIDQCPVDIEHIDHFIDLRRHQVLMESTFPTQLGKMFLKSLKIKAILGGLPAKKDLIGLKI